MKKLVFMMIAVFAISLSSCGGNKAGNPEAADTTSVDSTAAADVQGTVNSLTQALKDGDAATFQNLIQASQKKYQELAESGNVEEAKSYLAQIKEFIDANAEKIKAVAAGDATIATLVEGVKALPTDASATAENVLEAAKQAVTNSAKAVGDSAVKKANETVENAKNAAKKKVNDKVNEETEKAQKKADEAIQKGADAVSEGLKKVGL